VGVALPDDDAWAGQGGPLPDALAPDDAVVARALSGARRAWWVGGRVALRAALAAAGARDIGALGRDARGAPVVPSGFVGSISHKRTIAAALAAPADGDLPATIGVDVEVPRPLRQDIGRLVLTARERTALAGLAGAARDRELVRLFSAKEAIYKALDPWVRRFVSFQEVEIETASGAALDARLALSGGEGPFAVTLEDASDGDLILVAARVAPASSLHQPPS
jgi:4'-phosphopantetheinyl transferase EntD